MAIILGGNIIVSKKSGNSYTAIAAAKSCEIEVGHEDIEVSSATNGDWKHYIVGRSSWKVTVNGLVQNVKNTLLQSSDVQLRIALRGSSSDYVGGYAILKSIRMTGSKGNIGQYSCVFTGNGVLS